MQPLVQLFCLASSTLTMCLGHTKHFGRDDCNPCHLGGPQPFRAGEKIRSGPQVGELAT